METNEEMIARLKRMAFINTQLILLMDSPAFLSDWLNYFCEYHTLRLRGVN